MKITLVIADHGIYPATVPYPGCGYAQADTSCPECFVEPVQINGARPLSTVRDLDDGRVRHTIRAIAICRECGRVIGSVRAHELFMRKIEVREASNGS